MTDCPNCGAQTAIVVWPFVLATLAWVTLVVLLSVTGVVSIWKDATKRIRTLEMHLEGVGLRYLDLQRQTAAARTILAARLGRPGLDQYEVAQAFDLLATCEALQEAANATDAVSVTQVDRHSGGAVELQDTPPSMHRPATVAGDSAGHRERGT